MTQIGTLIAQLTEQVQQHDRTCSSPAIAIGMNSFDIERLHLEEGEEILPGIRLQADSGPPETARIICNGQYEQTETRKVQICLTR